MKALLALLGLVSICVVSSHGQLTITPTFAKSIKRLKDAAAVEASIDAAITNIEGDISNPITVTIDFTNVLGGLGSSVTPTGSLAYSTYLSDLQANPDQSANDKTALANLPAGPNTGINNNTDVTLTAALFAALGDTTEAGTLIKGNRGFNSTIFLNLRAMNISRTGKQNANKYDLESVAAHEIDEALGIGGDGSTLYEPGARAPRFLPSDGVGPLDLFRYSAPGVQSFTYNPKATAYFSIDGGVTDLTNFNQDGKGGSDFGDWGGAGPREGSNPPQVQDAFGTPGSAPDLGVNELTALDVVGYTLTSGTLAAVSTTPQIREATSQMLAIAPVPEPKSYLVIGGLVILGVRYCRRKAV